MDTEHRLEALQTFGLDGIIVRPQSRQPRDDGSQGQSRQWPASRLFCRDLAWQHVGERQP